MSDLIERQDVIDFLKLTRDSEYKKSMSAECKHKSVIRSKHDAHVAFCDYLIEYVKQVPTHETPSNTLGAVDCVSRQAAIDAVKEYFKFSPLEGRQCAKAIERVPSAQSEQKWETCFDCPLSHGCPKINGCTNGQTMEYASDIPYDCPIPVQPRKGKWIDYSDEGFVECPFCHSATNCDGNKDELHYCFSCGAELR